MAKDAAFLVRECKRQGLEVVNVRDGSAVRNNGSEVIIPQILSRPVSMYTDELKAKVGFMDPAKFDEKRNRELRQKRLDEARERADAEIQRAEERMAAEQSKVSTPIAATEEPEPEAEELEEAVPEGWAKVLLPHSPEALVDMIPPTANGRYKPDWKCPVPECSFHNDWPPSRGKHLAFHEIVAIAAPRQPKMQKTSTGSFAAGPVSIEEMSLDEMTRRGAFRKVIVRMREGLEWAEHLVDALEKSEARQAEMQKRLHRLERKIGSLVDDL